MIPPTAALAGLGYMSYLAFCPEGRPKPGNRCNTVHRLDEKKVVDSVDIEDIAEKAAYCRCWKSQNVSLLTLLISVYIFQYNHLWIFVSISSGLIVTALMALTTRRPAIMSVPSLSSESRMRRPRNRPATSCSLHRHTKYFAYFV